MGQKSNILTLRKKTSNINLFKDNSKEFLYGFAFLNSFDNFLKKKYIYVANRELNFIGNQGVFVLSLFYRSNKISRYKKKRLLKKLTLQTSSSLLNKINSKKLTNIFSHHLLKFKTTNVILNIKNLNKFVNKSFLKNFYSKIKLFMNPLFERRLNLFIDFLKISSLFFYGKVNLSSYMYFLAQIFRILQKKKHAKFFFFLKVLFTFLLEFKPKTFLDKKKSITNDSNSDFISGIKFVVNGKLRGKPRSDSTCIQVGAVPIQTISKNIDFSKTHVYTLYGVFGFQMWVFRDSKKIKD